MKQQVNLLDPELLPKKEPLSSALIMLMPLVVAVALLAFYGYARWELNQVRTDLTKLTAAEETLIQQLEQTVTKFPRQERDTALEQKIRDLGDEKALKLQVLETLKGRTLGNTQGFADHLETISTQWLEGLWLRKVVVDGDAGELRLTGYTTGPTLPPKLVENLGKKAPLTGTDFRTFRISSIERQGGILKFELDTRRVEPVVEEIEEYGPGIPGMPGMPGMPADFGGTQGLAAMQQGLSQGNLSSLLGAAAKGGAR